MRGKELRVRTKSRDMHSTEMDLQERRHRSVFGNEISAIKSINSTERYTFKPKEVNRGELERKSISTRELTMDQFRMRLKQCLATKQESQVSKTIPLDLVNLNIMKRSQEHFGVNMFKNKTKKKINLKILEGINPQRYQPRIKDLSIREVRMNQRPVLHKYSSGERIINSHGSKSWYLDFKTSKKKHFRNNSFNKRQSGQFKKIDSFHPSTLKAWESLMQPWKSWQQDQNFQGHSLQ